MAATTETFDAEVVQATKPVLVDFWGPRCGPCLALMPFVEALAGRYNSRLKVVKVNSAENRRLCAQLKVMSLPTFLFYSGGQEVDRLTGEITTTRLQQWVQEKLS